MWGVERGFSKSIQNYPQILQLFDEATDQVRPYVVFLLENGGCMLQFGVDGGGGGIEVVKVMRE
mgnify:CR=1 FL=1